MQIRDKKMAQEENKNVERSWQETQHTIAQQALRLASLENECKKKLLEANHRYNQALVSAFFSSYPATRRSMREYLGNVIDIE